MSEWVFGELLVGPIKCRCSQTFIGPHGEDTILYNGRTRHGFDSCSFSTEDNTYGEDVNWVPVENMKLDE